LNSTAIKLNIASIALQKKMLNPCQVLSQNKQRVH